MSTTFFCNLSLPVLVGEDRYRYLPVVAVFRSIPFDQLDEWVMHPDGQPRSTANWQRKCLWRSASRLAAAYAVRCTPSRWPMSSNWTVRPPSSYRPFLQPCRAPDERDSPDAGLLQCLPRASTGQMATSVSPSTTW